MKVWTVAMYLPQFHNVKENDEWWGEGYTEWTSVKAAKSLFEGHNQPVVPYLSNYYDLMKKETMQWQADLMHKYGIDGMCFYHYWFKDGQRILEKPAENLLKWKDVDMPFCFCWANESWIRTWSNLKNGNVWDIKHEKKDCSERGVLLEQKYGDVDSWKMHFEYLVEFFKDDRYIKIDNKPVFLIYRPQLIFCLEEMLTVWRKLAQEAGFNGMYIIASNCDETTVRYIDVELIHEPQATFMKNETKGMKGEGVKHIWSYDDIWKEILNYTSISSKVCYGGFVNYDDTPRRGGLGTAVLGGSPDKFKEYLAELYAKNVATGVGIVFLNAWNEWGEGMYLEPDSKHEEKYLEAVLYAQQHYKEYMKKYEQEKQIVNGFNEMVLLQDMQEKVRRYEKYWKIMHKWLLIKESNASIAEYLYNINCKKIAIYGMGMLGKHLVKELEDTNIEICYGIDKNAKYMMNKIDLQEPDEELGQVDVIIVTVVYEYEKIKQELNKCCPWKILSLEQILEEC